jgi:hypothetical protein
MSNPQWRVQLIICFDVLVSASREPFACLPLAATPGYASRTFGDCHNFEAYPQCLAE